MRAQRLTCPDCGAHLKVKEPRSFVFCEYCGTQIYIDDEVKRTEHTINQNININKTVNNKQIIENRAEIEKHKADRASSASLAIMLIVCAIVMLVAGLSSDPSAVENIRRVFDFQNQESQITYVVMPSSSIAYSEENYETVIQELEDAGFTNITAVKDTPNVIGAFIYDDDEVMKVTINDKDVEAGKEYPSDAKIIVTYCYYK